MALFEWVAAMEIVCKDSVEKDKGRFILHIKDRNSQLETDRHFMMERALP